MINISVYSEKYIEIESKTYRIGDQDSMVTFIKDLLDRTHYGGEKMCLEKATIVENKVEFEEIDRWP